jgi:hypothetical protein
MAQRGPVITAVVVLGGLVGFMTVNASGGLVVASGTPAPDATSTEAPPPTTTVPPTTTTTTTTTTTEAPPPPAFPAEIVYAGHAVDSPLAIAIAVKGAAASAYICDGAAVEAWFRGVATDGRVDLATGDGASRLQAALDGPNLTGSVTIGGQDVPFTIGVAAPPAGLYRGSDGVTTVGWIILPSGSQVGIANTEGEREPAPELDPDEGGVTVDGRRLDAQKIAGDSAFG